MNITIPPEALEAAAKAVRDARLMSRTSEETARAACIAMLEAWAGMWPYKYHLIGEHSLILPLPQKEKSE